MMGQDSELINFILSGSLFVFFIVVFGKSRLKISLFILYGIIVLLFAQVFTIIESYLLNDLFNHLEHFSYLISSVFILFGLIRYKRSF